MKKGIVILIALCLALALSSCGWLDGEYHSVTPYLQQGEQSDQEQTVCLTYAQVRASLVDLVEEGAVKGVIYVHASLLPKIDEFMGNAIVYATTNNAIGAYAVEGIAYETGTNAALPAVAVDIAYTHNRSELLRIRHTEDMEQVKDVIALSLQNCDAGVVIKVDDYDEMDLTQVVADYVDNNPATCMEQPQVGVWVVPEKGSQRVIELTFTYQTSRDDLRSMQTLVEPVFSSAELYVQGGGENWEKYAQLYSFLMERFDYKIETSITPSYSLLRYGIGDSKAFATVYSQMCKRAGLDCQAIAGTKSGTPQYWNVICEDGLYYHIDLLQCKQEGNFKPRLTDEMKGYVWDYSAFPEE